MKVREIADIIAAELFGDGDIEITGIASLKNATHGDLAFSESPDISFETGASCVILPTGSTNELGKAQLRVDDPKLEFSRVSALLIERPKQREWHKTAAIAHNADVRASFVGAFVTIGEGSTVGEGTEIGSGVQIGRSVIIGKNTVLHPNCVIYDGAMIGNDCVIHAGAVIGADGFGYVRDKSGEHLKFPQVGSVVVENNVEVGANSCIDRGSLGETRIGEGTKIDNLVQIAHNVKIGKRCIIVSLTGISGSSVLEDDVVLAGQVGIADHVVLKSGVTIGAKSAVFPNKVIHSGFWCGIPVQRINDYKRQHAMLKGLGRLKQQIRDLKSRLDPQ